MINVDVYMSQVSKCVKKYTNTSIFTAFHFDFNIFMSSFKKDNYLRIKYVFFLTL